MSESTAAALGRVLIVGAGNMGSAICSGLLGIEGMTKDAICLADTSEDKRAKAEQTLGVSTVADGVCGLPARTIVLAVKPNIVLAVARELAEAGIEGSRVISVAAGMSTAKLSACFPDTVPVVRVMPNTPLLVGQGMSAVCGGAHASEDDVALVADVFSRMGKAVVLDEGKFDAVTALSGSGPAYFELVCEALARGAEKQGLPYDVACELAVQTMRGTATLIEETGQSLPDAIAAVSSPGGTTVAALETMRGKGVEEALDSGVEAATRRSRELGA